MTNEIGQSRRPAVNGECWVLTDMARLFASESLVKLMGIFLLHPDEQYFQRELARLTGAGLYLVQRDLERLGAAGLVSKRRSGKHVYYRAVRAHPTFEDFRHIFLKTFAFGDTLREALAAEGGAVELAFIHGSFARGEEDAESDIDLVLVGDVTLRRASEILGPLERELAREINPSVYSHGEFASRVRAREHFVTTVLGAPKIWLIGDDDTLGGLVGQQA